MSREILPGSAVILNEEVRGIDKGKQVIFGSKHELVKVTAVDGKELEVEGRVKFCVMVWEVRTG